MMPGFKFKLLSTGIRTLLILLLGALLVILPQEESLSAPYATMALGQHSQPKAEPLEPGKYLERKLEGGQSHLYEIRMTAEQFLRVVVDQRGIDVALTMLGPDGGRLSNVNNRQGERGSESASVVTHSAGVYRIEVSSVRKADPMPPRERTTSST